MSLQCLPSSFGSNGPTVWEKMSFEEVQDGRHGHLGYRNVTILAILDIYIASMPPIKFPLMVWEEMSIEEFQEGPRGGNLGYRSGTILAILNLCVTVMLNPT